MKRIGQWLLVLLVLVFAVIGLRSCFSSYVLQSVSGTSMEPSLVDGAKVLIDRNQPITRYAMIGFAVKGEPNLFVKRVIGLPGDEIFVTGTRMVINLDTETHYATTISIDLTDSVATEWQAVTRIPENCYFVLGDHLSVSKDSRTFGWVEKQAIEGSVRVANN